MEITIKCEPNEIAALVVGLQERRSADDLAEAILDKVNGIVADAKPFTDGPHRER